MQHTLITHYTLVTHHTHHASRSCTEFALASYPTLASLKILFPVGIHSERSQSDAAYSAANAQSEAVGRLVGAFVPAKLLSKGFLSHVLFHRRGGRQGRTCHCLLSADKGLGPSLSLSLSLSLLLSLS